MSDKLLADFLKAQKDLIQPPPKKKPTPTHKNIIATPGTSSNTMNELSFNYIVDKKPKAKKVIKYLQHMVDDIMAEAD